MQQIDLFVIKIHNKNSYNMGHLIHFRLMYVYLIDLFVNQIDLRL